MAWKVTTPGGGSYTGATAYIRLLFTKIGLFITIYVLIGIFYNTAPPHLPAWTFSQAGLHSWIQYFISILLWPLSFWHPIFSISHWPPGSAR